MIIVDAHCDTLTKTMSTGEGLYKNSCHLDISRLTVGHPRVQFFAAFLERPFDKCCAVKRILEIIDAFYREMDKNRQRAALCLNYGDIVKAAGEKKLACILSIEGGEALEGELSLLRIYYRLGVRCMGLTWNKRNQIADGVDDGDSGGGLTPFGRKVVREMEALGMIVDVSHLSERGFWDVIETARRPVIASHSNAMKLCPHRRNLKDDQIAALAGTGGVIGVNLYHGFLRQEGKAGIWDVIRHIEYIAGIAGLEHVGLGSDFDGDVGSRDWGQTPFLPEGIRGAEDMEKIFEELARLNYSQAQIEAVAGLNFLRVIREVLGQGSLTPYGPVGNKAYQEQAEGAKEEAKHYAEHPELDVCQGPFGHIDDEHLQQEVKKGED